MAPRLHDLPKQGDTETVNGETFVFDERAAQRVVNFFEHLLVHGDAQWAGKPFRLQDWQYRITWNVFGWKRQDGTRRYREVFVGIARKNGKSTWGAGLALYLLLADGEAGARIYGAAEDREQASEIYRIAATMVHQSPRLRDALVAKGKRVDVLPSTRTIAVVNANEFYRAIPADASSAHGFNAHAAIIDELHTQPNRDLVDVLRTSMGARLQPLTFYFTTAGFDKKTICGEIWARADQVMRGVLPTTNMYAAIYSADPTLPLDSVEALKQANPSWDEFGKPFQDFLLGKMREAIESPPFENTYRRLHRNEWTAQNVRWMPMAAWDASAGFMPDEKALEGRTCYAGLDLSSTVDLTALALVFPPEDGDPNDDGIYQVVMRIWIPEENIERRSRNDGVPYEVWAREGWLRTTPGNAVDYRYIREEILALAKKYHIAEVGFDRWGATQISQELADEGLTIVAIGQGFRDMSYPTKELLRLVLGRRVQHGGHPVLRWAADNLDVRQDPAGNLKPDKEKSREKIDPAVALIMAFDRARRHAAEPRIRRITVA